MRIQMKIFLAISLASFCTFSFTLINQPLRGCPNSGYLRLVNVSSSSSFASALDNALPGDQIRLAAGVYSGGFSVVRGGSSSAAVTICGLPGVWPKITGGTFKVRNNYLRFTGLLFEGPNASQNNVGVIGVHDILFSGNEIRNGDYHAGIAVDTTYNVEITYNYIHDNGLTDIDHGIYYRTQAGRGNVIANNVIVKNHGRGISLHDNEGLAISDTVVVNNTIIGNGSTGILVSTNGGSGNIIANNILAGSGALYKYRQITLRSGSGNLILNNVVWSTVLDRQGIGIENNLSGNTVSGNLILDPKFEDAANRNYHLLSDSPAVSLAKPEYAVALDFEGYLRDSAPDAGAYEAEVAVAPPTAPPPPTPVPPTQPLPPPPTAGSRKFIAVADSFTSRKSASSNYGAKAALSVDGENRSEAKRAYLKFVVSGVGAVKKATLRIFITGSSKNGPALYLTTNSWSENLLNWSNQPALIGAAIEDKGAVSAGTWVQYNVTNSVAADGTYSFAVVPTSDDSVFFSSREAASNRPELLLEY